MGFYAGARAMLELFGELALELQRGGDDTEFRARLKAWGDELTAFQKDPLRSLKEGMR